MKSRLYCVRTDTFHWHSGLPDGGEPANKCTVAPHLKWVWIKLPSLDKACLCDGSCIFKEGRQDSPRELKYTNPDRGAWNPCWRGVGRAEEVIMERNSWEKVRDLLCWLARGGGRDGVPSKEHVIWARDPVLGWRASEIVCNGVVDRTEVIRFRTWGSFAENPLHLMDWSQSSLPSVWMNLCDTF